MHRSWAQVQTCPATLASPSSNFTSVAIHHTWWIYVIKPISSPHTILLNNKIIIYWLFKKGTYARVMALYHTTGPAINKAGRENGWERWKGLKQRREREKWRGTKWLLNKRSLDPIWLLAACIKKDIIQSSVDLYGSMTHEYFFYTYMKRTVDQIVWLLRNCIPFSSNFEVFFSPYSNVVGKLTLLYFVYIKKNSQEIQNYSIVTKINYFFLCCLEQFVA